MSLFGKKNSIVLVLDVTTFDDAQLAIDQIGEVRKYYRLGKVSDLLDKETLRMGMAAIALRRPTKGAFLHLVPSLVDTEIPFSLFVDPELVGTNRLPIESELQALRASQPQALSESVTTALIEKCWAKPVETAEEIAQLKRTYGPLPLAMLSPESFMATWGEIQKRLTPKQEVGIEISFSPLKEDLLVDQLQFLIRQWGGEVRVAFSQRKLTSSEVESVQSLGLVGSLSSEVRALESRTPLWNMPIWKC